VKPTNPLLVNGPTVNRAFARDALPPGSEVKNTEPSSSTARTGACRTRTRLSVGYEQQLGPTLSVSADFVHAFGRDQFMSFDQNAGLRTTTSRTAPIIRPDPNFVGQVLVRENLGQTDYDALMMQVEKR